MNKLKILISLSILIFLFATISNAQNTGKTDVKKEDPMSKVDKMPEFKGGMESLVAFVAKNLKYPKKAREAGIEGTVYVKFFVDADGSVSLAKITKGVSLEIDREALRVINKMPKWKPGEKDSKVVKVAMMLPLNFKLSAED